MIDTTTIAWVAVGWAIGWLHVTLLCRSTHRPTAWTPVLGVLRLGAVTAVLVVAALAGAILAAACGWAVAFVFGSIGFATRRTDRMRTARLASPSDQRNVPHAP
ncbi:MAG: hypothetical protein H6821_09075 [Planctomycetaceae bacterium]|nr:hypothetical protein [Planctomycetales bacterium]MCB9874315.1 hypothetical protein [Planctomycetaceae bacterium]MCB9941526.1 hypothetical protein [Planctomycetaceae bacterium]